MKPIYPGAPVWADAMTTDTAQAKKFYGEVFGWSFQETPENFGGYINILRDTAMVAGLMEKTEDMAEFPDVWSVYLSTEDADAAVDAVQAAGGQVHLPVTSVGDLGRMAMVTDSSGASFGLWESGTHRGFGEMMQPGTPFWFELLTRDFAAASSFYSRVFGTEFTEVSDSPAFRYSTFGEGDSAVAGIMDASDFLPPHLPSHWQIYWAVENADDAAAAITRLGGTVLQEPEDTPFGRIGSALDPFGSPFKFAEDTAQRSE